MAIDRKAMTRSAIRHEETRLCPYYFDLEPVVAERMDAHYGGPAWRNKYRNYIQRFSVGVDGRLEPGPPIRRDHYGSLWRLDLRPFHLEEPVLQEPSLRGYTFPDPDRLLPADWEKSARQFLADYSDCFTTASFGLGVFERSWTLRGFENLLADAAEEPAFFEDLFAAVAAHQEKIFERFLSLPFDAVMFSDDWGDQRGVLVGPRRWREVMKPHYARMYVKVKAAGKYAVTHCCGAISDIIPDLIEIGLDVLESVQAEARDMSPYGLKDRFGDRLTFWGGIGSQSIIPLGTPGDLRREIPRLAAHMRKGGGYILSCAKTLQPETPVENAVAIFEEFLALGERA
jgi:uroporphyrinogen decarboxylase